MRIWKIPLQYMCIRHINGQHNEIHKHLPSLYQGVKIDGRFNPIAQIELWSLQQVHDEVARYLPNHNSPIETDDYWLFKLYPQYYYKRVDLEYNIKDLADRCKKCKELLKKGGLI